MQQRLTMDTIKQIYPPERYIHVVPSVSKHLLGPSMYGIDVATCKIDPNEPKMVYPIKTQGFGDDARVTEVGLSATAVNRLAGMADISVVIDNVADTGDLLVIRATAIMQTPGGSVRGRSVQVRWDRALLMDKLSMAAEDYVENAIARKWNNFRDLSPEQKAAAINKKYRKDLIAECEFGPRKTESKAARNAVKHLLGIADTYHPQELIDKEFAVVKFVFSPDLTDPMVKRMVVESGLRAQRALFGVSVANASGSQYLPAEVMETPAALGIPAHVPEQVDDVEELVADDSPPDQTPPPPVDTDPMSEPELVQRVVRRRIEEAKGRGVSTKLLDQWMIRFSDYVVDTDIEALKKLATEIKTANKGA